MLAASTVAGSLAYGAQKGQQANNSVQQLRDEATASFHSVQNALLDVDQRTQSQINNLKTTISQIPPPPPISSLPFIPKISNFTTDDLVKIDGQGNVQDSGFRINDSSPADPHVLWTSSKIPQLDGYAGNLALFDGKGNVADYGVTLDDTMAPDSYILYSSAKQTENLKRAIDEAKFDTGANKMNLVPEASQGAIAAFDNSGQVKSSGVNVSDVQQAAQAATQASQALVQASQAAQSATQALSIAQSAVAPKLQGSAGNIPLFNGTGGIQDSMLSPNMFMSKNIPSQTNNLAALDASGQVKDSLFLVNDNLSGPSVIWTSSGLSSKFQKKLAGQGTLPLLSTTGDLQDSFVPISTVMKKSVPLGVNDIPFLDTSGQIVDSGYTIGTNQGPNVLWSSDTTLQHFVRQLPGQSTFALLGPDGQLQDSGVQAIQKLSVPKQNNSFAVLDATGQVQDSGYSVDNSQINSNSLWTSDVINADFVKVKPGIGLAQLGNDGQLYDSMIQPENVMLLNKSFKAGNLSEFDTSGQVVDSSYYVQDTALAAPQVLWSSDKIDRDYVKNLGSGDNSLALVLSTGDFVSSGVYPSDFMPKVVGGSQNNVLSLGPNGIAQDTGIRIYDTATAQPNIVWSSSKNEQVYLKRLQGTNLVQLGMDGQLHDSGVDTNNLLTTTIPVKPNSVALLNASGTLQDSEIIIDDTSLPAPDVIWTSNKIAAIGTGLAQMTSGGTLYDTGINPSDLLQKVQNVTPGNLSALDSSGLIYDSGFSVQDHSDLNTQVLWSSKKIDSDYVKKLVGNYTVPYLGPDGQLYDSTESLNNFTKTVVPLKSNSLATLSDSGQLQDSTYQINDNASSSNNTLWSSSKIDTSYLKKPTSFSVGDVATFNEYGQLQDSLYTINDASLPNANILWSSDKISSLVTTIPSKPGNLPQLNANGSISDSNYSIDDTLVNNNTLWSSSKIDSLYTHKPTSYLSGNLALFDASGNVEDQGFSIDDNSASPSVLWTSQKVLARTIPSNAGNLAALNLDGTLSDSLYSVNDNSSSTNTLWSAAKINSDLIHKPTSFSSGNVAIFDALGNVQDTGIVVSDASPVASSVLWSSQKMDNVFMPRASPSTTGNLPLFGANGALTDSGLAINDTEVGSNNLWSSQKISNTFIPKLLGATQNDLVVVKSDGTLNDSGVLIGTDVGPNILWTSDKITDAIVQSTPKIIPTTAGNFAALNSDGTILDSLYKVNDTLQSTQTLWSSDKIGSTFIPRTIPSQDGNLASLSSSGLVQDSVYKVDDTNAQDANILWSSNKIDTNYVKKLVGNGSIVTLGSDGQMHDSSILPNTLQTKIIPSTVNNLAQLDATGSVADSGYTISDGTNASNNVLWSSSKIDTSYVKQLATSTNLAQLGTDGQLHDSGLSTLSIAEKKVPSSAGAIATLDATGGLNDSGLTVKDSSQAASNILWSSSKITSTFPTQVTSTTNLAQLGTDGQLHDSGISVPNVMVKTVPGTAGNLATLSVTGQVQDSGFLVSDTSVVGPSILWSTSKNDSTFVKQLVGNNTIAILGLDGQLHDSGQTTTLFTQKSIPAKSGNLAALDSTGQLIDSTYNIDDSAVANASVLWTSNKIDTNFVKKVTGTNLAQLGTDGQLHDSGVVVSAVMLKSAPLYAGAIATLNASGQTTDSGYSINDALAVGPKVLWSTEQINASYMNKTVPIIANSLLTKKADGNLQETGIVINDSQNASTTVLWTSNKTDQHYVIKPTPATDGNCLQFDSTGAVVSLKPFKAGVQFVPNSTWVWGNYMGLMVDANNHVWVVSKLIHSPRHTCSFDVRLIFGSNNYTTNILSKKYAGPMPYVDTGALDINLMQAPSGWGLTNDDQLVIHLCDRGPPMGYFRMTCKILGAVTAHVISVEQLG